MEYSIIPSPLFVGDKAKCIIKLDSSHKIKNSSFDMGKLEKSETLTIDDILISSIEGMPCLVIEFTPWQTGDIDFPSLKNIDLDIELPTITVASILEIEGLSQRLQEARQPILLDGTVFMIYKGITLLVFFFLLLTFFLVFFKKKGRALLKRFSNNCALFLFGLNLKRLRRELKKIKFDFSFETSDILSLKKLKGKKQVMKEIWAKTYEDSLRKCLAGIYKRKINLNWASLTYSEMEKVIACELKSLELQEDCLQNIKNIFQLLSCMRFDTKNVSEEDASGACLEQELLSLSFKFVALHKRRNYTNSER